MNRPARRVELDAEALHSTVARALAEDLGCGDVTTDAIIPADRVATARLLARSELVVAGMPVAHEVFLALDPHVRFGSRAAEGELVAAGQVLAELEGLAAALLRGERTALNLVMRASGIASATRRAVDEIAGTGAYLLDTRKTAPGLRWLDKYAVAVGGGVNHRLGLFDAVMIKDTHLGVVGSIRDAVERCKHAKHPAERITVEVRDLDELREAIEAGAGRALLDNMSLERLTAAVREARGRIVLEASGGLRPGRLRAVAETGVDCLSLGWLTHSAPAADVAMEIDPGTQR